MVGFAKCGPRSPTCPTSRVDGVVNAPSAGMSSGTVGTDISPKVNWKPCPEKLEQLAGEYRQALIDGGIRNVVRKASQKQSRAGRIEPDPQHPGRWRLVNPAVSSPRRRPARRDRLRARLGIPRKSGSKPYRAIEPTPTSRSIGPKFGLGLSTTAGTTAGARMEGGIAANTGHGTVDVVGGGVAASGVTCGLAGADLYDSADDLKKFLSTDRGCELVVCTTFWALMAWLANPLDASDEVKALAARCDVALQGWSGWQKASRKRRRELKNAVMRDAFGAGAAAVSTARGATQLAGAAGAPVAASLAPVGAIGSVAALPFIGFEARGVKAAWDRLKAQRRQLKASLQAQKTALCELEARLDSPMPPGAPPEYLHQRQMLRGVLRAWGEQLRRELSANKAALRTQRARGVKCAVNASLVVPLSLGGLAFAPLFLLAVLVGAPPALAYLGFLGARLGLHGGQKRRRHRDAEAADAFFATNARADLPTRVTRESLPSLSTQHGDFTGGPDLYADERKAEIDFCTNPMAGLGLFAFLCDEWARNHALVPEVQEGLASILAAAGWTPLKFELARQSVFAEAERHKSACGGVDDDDVAWYRLTRWQAALAPCMNLARDDQRLSDGLFVQWFFAARLAVRAEQGNAAAQQQKLDEHFNGNPLGLRELNELSEGRSLVDDDGSLTEEEMHRMADVLFTGMPQPLFLERARHFLSMAAAARRQRGFDWAVDAPAARGLERFCDFLETRRTPEATLLRRVAPKDAADDDALDVRLRALGPARLARLLDLLARETGDLSVCRGLETMEPSLIDAVRRRASALWASEYGVHADADMGWWNNGDVLSRLWADRYRGVWVPHEGGHLLQISPRRWAWVPPSEIARCAGVPGAVPQVVEVPDPPGAAGSYRELSRTRNGAPGNGILAALHMLTVRRVGHNAPLPGPGLSGGEEVDVADTVKRLNRQHPGWTWRQHGMPLAHEQLRGCSEAVLVLPEPGARYGGPERAVLMSRIVRGNKVWYTVDDPADADGPKVFRKLPLEKDGQGLAGAARAYAQSDAGGQPRHWDAYTLEPAEPPARPLQSGSAPQLSSDVQKRSPLPDRSMVPTPAP